MKVLLLLFAFTAGLTAKETLHVFTWADYVSPECIESFEEKHDCRVVIDTFDSNESLYAKLKAGASGYDVLFPTAYMIQIMHQEGMIADLDHVGCRKQHIVATGASFEFGIQRFIGIKGVDHHAAVVLCLKGLNALGADIIGPSEDMQCLLSCQACGECKE